MAWEKAQYISKIRNIYSDKLILDSLLKHFEHCKIIVLSIPTKVYFIVSIKLY